MLKVLLTSAVCLVLISAASARPEYAKKEGQKCAYCHINYAAGYFTYRGMYYKLHNRSFASFDNLAEAKLAGVAPDSEGDASAPTNNDYPNVGVPAALNFTVKDRQGNPIRLSRYQGSVVLVVNVTTDPNNLVPLRNLAALYAKYKDNGLVILGFPTNDLGTEKVAFPIFSKVAVKGEGVLPFYKFLTDKATNPRFGGAVEASFTIFIISRSGQVIGRFKADTAPLPPEVVRMIEKELAAK